MNSFFDIFAGPFSTAQLENEGFTCPKLTIPLRNPLKIAEYAYDVIKDGANNLLDYGILRSPIEISRATTNLVEGEFIKIRPVEATCTDALVTALQKIPHEKKALIFLETEEDPETIKEAFSSTNRETPKIFTGTEETSHLKKWLCEPQKRKFDMCIIGAQHQCNGIETELVVHVYPANCPFCKISNADPVIISRAKAMLIVATYQRIKCSCGWKQRKPKNDESLKESVNTNRLDDINTVTAHTQEKSSKDLKMQSKLLPSKTTVARIIEMRDMAERQNLVEQPTEDRSNEITSNESPRNPEWVIETSKLREFINDFSKSAKVS
jgi:hypothetical protein